MDTQLDELKQLVAAFNVAAQEQRTRVERMMEIIANRRGYRRIRFGTIEGNLAEAVTNPEAWQLSQSQSTALVDRLCPAVFDYEPGTE